MEGGKKEHGREERKVDDNTQNTNVSKSRVTRMLVAICDVTRHVSVPQLSFMQGSLRLDDARRSAILLVPTTLELS